MSKSLDDAGGDFGKTGIYKKKHIYITFILLFLKNGSVILFYFLFFFGKNESMQPTQGYK